MLPNANRFARGSGVYVCRCCKRSTRATGRGDNDSVRLCVECYELAGEENSLADMGEFYAHPEDVLSLIAAVEDKGGDAAVWDDLKAAATARL
jgi:hypothetical protein